MSSPAFELIQREWIQFPGYANVYGYAMCNLAADSKHSPAATASGDSKAAVAAAPVVVPCVFLATSHTVYRLHTPYHASGSGENEFLKASRRTCDVEPLQLARFTPATEVVSMHAFNRRSDGAPILVLAVAVTAAAKSSAAAAAGAVGSASTSKSARRLASAAAVSSAVAGSNSPGSVVTSAASVAPPAIATNATASSSSSGGGGAPLFSPTNRRTASHSGDETKTAVDSTAGASGSVPAAPAAPPFSDQPQAQRSGSVSASRTRVVYYLYIYGSQPPQSQSQSQSGSGSGMSRLCGECRAIELSFVPFVITHTGVLSGANSGSADIVLAGGDRSVHVYRPRASDGAYAEVPFTHSHPLPELMDTPSPVTAIDFGVVRGNTTAAAPTDRRIVAAGCQNGLVSVSTLPFGGSSAANSWEADITQTYVDGPVSSLALFSRDTLQPDFTRSRTAEVVSGYEQQILGVHRAAAAATAATAPVTSSGDSKLSAAEPAAAEWDGGDVHLLVGGAIGVATLFRSVNRSSPFDDAHTTPLPRSDAFDSVTCTHTGADLTLDGTRSLLCGTAGCQLLCYTPTRDQSSATGGSGCGYDLSFEKTFAYPVHAVDSVNLSACGIPEVVVMTQRTCNVLSLPTQAVARRLALTTDLLSEIAALQTQIAQLKAAPA